MQPQLSRTLPGESRSADLVLRAVVVALEFNAVWRGGADCQKVLPAPPFSSRAQIPVLKGGLNEIAGLLAGYFAQPCFQRHEVQVDRQRIVIQPLTDSPIVRKLILPDQFLGLDKGQSLVLQQQSRFSRRLRRSRGHQRQNQDE